MTQTICKVCGGLGGWKKEVKHWSDTNWNDCHYCEGYGFIDGETKEQSDSSFLLAYNGYKKIITDVLENYGKLISYQTQDQGKSIEISLVPNNKQAFADFTKALLKFGYFHTRLNVTMYQAFFYEPTDGLFHYYWKMVLSPQELTDLDGFVDLIRQWEPHMTARRLRE